MPPSTDVARQVAERVRAIYQAAEDGVMRLVARRLAQGLDTPEWAARKAADLPGILREVERYMARLDEAAPSLIERSIAEAYQQGAATAALDLRAAGVTPTPIGGTDASSAVQALAEDMVAALSGSAPRVVRATRDIYQTVTADAAGQVAAGATTLRDAVGSSLRRYAGEGIKAFRDKSGRTWELASYADMATRTAVGKASRQGHLDRLRDLGQDTVIVSDHGGSCPLCAPWEGRVLSITGRTTGKLSDGKSVAGTVRQAEAAGLHHPNCGHRFGIYLPGHTKPVAVKHDADEYRMSQRQRAYERQVRAWKRRAETDAAVYGKDSPEAKATRRKLRARQATFRAWREENGRKALPNRTSLTAR